jgi:hypothetical protein
MSVIRSPRRHLGPAGIKGDRLPFHVAQLPKLLPECFEVWRRRAATRRKPTDPRDFPRCLGAHSEREDRYAPKQYNDIAPLHWYLSFRGTLSDKVTQGALAIVAPLSVCGAQRAIWVKKRQGHSVCCRSEADIPSRLYGSGVPATDPCTAAGSTYCSWFRYAARWLTQTLAAWRR